MPKNLSFIKIAVVADISHAEQLVAKVTAIPGAGDLVGPDDDGRTRPARIEDCQDYTTAQIRAATSYELNLKHLLLPA